MKLFSGFLAFSIWVIHQSSQVTDVAVNVSLQYRNKPENLVFTEQPLQFLKVKLRGKKDAIKFSSGAMRAEVDLSNARQGRHNYPLLFDEKQLPEGVKAYNLPRTMNLYLEPVARIKAGVKVLFKGDLPDYLIKGRVKVEPETIEISGAQSVIKRIQQVETAPVNLNDREESFSTRAGLQPVEGVRYESADQVQIEVEILKDTAKENVTLKNISYQIRNLDPALEALVSENKIDIQVQVHKSLADKIDNTYFEAFINLKENWYNPNTGKVQPEAVITDVKIVVNVIKESELIRIRRISPATVTVRFNIKEKFKKVIEQTNRVNNE